MTKPSQHRYVVYETHETPEDILFRTAIAIKSLGKGTGVYWGLTYKKTLTGYEIKIESLEDNHDKA